MSVDDEVREVRYIFMGEPLNFKFKFKVLKLMAVMKLLAQRTVVKSETKIVKIKHTYKKVHEK